MKYLITGAGPVGRAVARELTARGHKCIIMSRHGSTLDLGPHVQHITGDATQKESYPADVDGIVHCIHAAYNAEDGVRSSSPLRTQPSASPPNAPSPSSFQNPSTDSIQATKRFHQIPL